LELAALRVTRAACPPPSLYERLARDWSYIRSYVRKDGHLFLALKADAGIYEFEPMAAKSAVKSAVKSLGPFTFRCQGPGGAGESLTATFYETQPGLLLLVRGGETRPAFSSTAASGAKYEGNEISYWEHQGEAVVDWSGTELRCKTSPGATLGGK
jgi:membrane-bound inhibitor of C-type lysozyme